jgi:Tfp pilus assembly protein PilN
MAQQINLYSPILLAPKRYFSAQAMAQSLAVLAVGLVALSLWSVNHTQVVRRNLASATAVDNAEQQRLKVALASRPVPSQSATNLSAMEQELAQVRGQLADREAMLASVSAPAPGSRISRSTLLRVLAQTLPDSAWLTEVKLVDGRVELAGATLQPETLRPWLDRLSANPALAGQALEAVRVERRDGDAASGREIWSFRVVSGRSATPAAAPAAAAPANAGERP